jgi:hypothetical protein
VNEDDRDVELPAAKTERLDERVMIPDLLQAHPQARPVLDRYGLRGCGGPRGPVESLGFFARAHDVPLERLLHEIRTAVEGPGSSSERPGPVDNLADSIYRPFFKAGIVITLTLGAVWGAYLLLRIAFQERFDAVGLHEVNAHGHAQIFGWVGLFVMGFAYQAFPRFKHASLAHPRLALLSFGLMLAGIVGRSVCEPLVTVVAWAGPVAVIASVLEVIAIALFAGLITGLLRDSGKRLEAYDYYLLSALAWFLVQAVYETVYLAATVSVTDPKELVALVATWQGALRDVQIHGFALLMILGVSQRIFPYFYGFPIPSRRLSLAALVAINTAVMGEALGLILMRVAGHAWAALWYASVLLLTGAVVLLVADWKIFSPSEDSDRSLKFLRAAYGWLALSLALLIFLPVYRAVVLPGLAPHSHAAQIGFSHAYYGAIRHAVTVGFVSLMIVGVAAKVVPTLNGRDVRQLSALWLPFVLINAGCALRVTAQTLTDFLPLAFPIAGASGLLEVTGLALWGIHLWSLMRGPAGEAFVPMPLEPGEPVGLRHRVADVLDRDPELLDVFLSFGFRPLANPVLRRTLGRTVTIAQACRLMGRDPNALLDALNTARRKPAGRKLALPVLPDEAIAP